MLWVFISRIIYLKQFCQLMPNIKTKSTFKWSSIKKKKKIWTDINYNNRQNLICLDSTIKKYTKDQLSLKKN